MKPAEFDLDQLVHEHHALLRLYAEVQTRCGALVLQQAAEIEGLRAQAMRQRAAIIVRDSALAWAREDRAALEAAIPGLPKRVVLAQHVESLMARVRDLMRERLHWHRSTVGTLPVAEAAPAAPDTEPAEELENLEASLVAADLVICQTGCLSHGAYWRVQDHCKRTGKACVLVEQPDALRIVRIHKPAELASSADAPSIHEGVLP